MALCLSSLVACGKKGPPLAPIVRIPAAITMISAQRVGNDFYLTLTVPTMNIDGTMPLDIGRIEVYGYTGTAAPPRGRFTEMARRVATIPVVPLPPDQPAPAASPAGEPSQAAGTVSAAGATPGSRVTVVDTMTPAELQAGTAPAPVPAPGAPQAGAAAAPVAAQPLRRFYIAVPFSPAGRFGPEPAVTAMDLVDPPPAPESLAATTTSDSVVLTWEPNGGIVGFLLGTPLPPEPNPTEDQFPDATAGSAGPVRYNVYMRETPLPGSAEAAAPAELPWQRTPGTPINSMPLSATMLSDQVVFGRERCYIVRAVRGTPPNAIESAPSAPACITPVDTYPPAIPKELVAVAAEGSISLIWEPGSDPDLAGYVVLRGTAGDATLRPLTLMPVTEARYIDTMVTAGTRYVYAVVAVDNAMPTPNMSAESMRVEETAR